MKRVYLDSRELNIMLYCDVKILNLERSCMYDNEHLKVKITRYQASKQRGIIRGRMEELPWVDSSGCFPFLQNIHFSSLKGVLGGHWVCQFWLFKPAPYFGIFKTHTLIKIPFNFYVHAMMIPSSHKSELCWMVV